MTNLFQLSEEEKNRIRGLHLTESKDKRFTSVLNEQTRTSYGGDSHYGDYLGNCVRFKFDSGGSEINLEPTIYGENDAGEEVSAISAVDLEAIKNSLSIGMETDRPFMEITVSVSGPGSSEANESVMNARIDASLNLLLDQMGDISGPSGLPYTAEHIKSKAEIKRVYGRDEPGSELDTGEMVPTDPDHTFHREQQYVTICFLDIDDTPGYDSLADQFMEATIRNNFGYSEETVYDILNGLRDAADFEEFSAELKRSYDMDFYEIACDKITMDLTPGWMDKILGTSGEVTVATEIGPDDITINVHLKRLGVDPIRC